eukprot:2121656-Pyramimonas_sp.AAC.1
MVRWSTASCFVICLVVVLVTVSCRADPILQHIGDKSSDIGRRGYTEFISTSRDGGEEDPVAVHDPKMSARTVVDALLLQPWYRTTEEGS